MTSSPSGPILLLRDCPAVLIPSGEPVTLPEDSPVVIIQTLGGSYTVQAGRGLLARIKGDDADALGLEQAAPAAAQAAAPGSFDLERVLEELRGVYDPEIPINVVDLGLIYACEARELPLGGQRVEIKMSMTAPGCGMGDVLKADAEGRVRTVPGVREVDVELVWDPPWTIDRMSEAARLELGLY